MRSVLVCSSELAREKHNWSTFPQLNPSPSSLAHDSHEIIRPLFTCWRKIGRTEGREGRRGGGRRKKMAIQWEKILISVKSIPKRTIKLLNRKHMILNRNKVRSVRSLSMFENLDIYKGRERKPMWMSGAYQKLHRQTSFRKNGFMKCLWTWQWKLTGRLSYLRQAHALTHQPPAPE